MAGDPGKGTVMETDNDIERQIKELERDKRLEEIRQLRASAKTRWITPAALAALLPLLAGFGVWIVAELKQYNEGYQALAERDALRREKDALQRQKDSLNIEVSTLLQLKSYYADEAQRLQRDTVAKQDVLDKTYLRGAFTMGEALYALDHIKGLGPGPDRNALQRLRTDAKQLPEQAGTTINDVLQRYELSMELIGITRQIISEFDSTLKVIPASEWTRALQGMPEGSVLSGRKIMVLQEKSAAPRYYDVGAGRFLTKEESERAQ
jgi:hypothetical protein